MRFSDSFFPQRIRPSIERAVSGMSKQPVERPSTLQEAFQRDPKRQPVEVAANGALCRTAENIGGLIHISRSESPNYKNATAALPGLYGRHVSVEGSGAYDHHPHPDEPGVMLASTVLRVTPKDYAAGGRLSYYILAMTPRPAGTDNNVSPSQDEYNNSVPVFLMPEEPGGGARVFTLSQTPCYYEQLTPADARAVYDTEVPHYIEAVGFWANST